MADPRGFTSRGCTLCIHVEKHEWAETFSAEGKCMCSSQPWKAILKPLLFWGWSSKSLYLYNVLFYKNRTTTRCSSLLYIIDLSTQSSKRRAFGGDWSHSRGSRGIRNIKAFLSRCWESARLFDASLCSALSLSAGRPPSSVCQCVRTHMYEHTDICIIRTLYRLAGAATLTQKGRKGTDLSRLVRR